MRRFWRRFSMWLRRSQLERELDEEIRFHLEMQKADGGRVSDFGGTTLVREVSRDNWGWPALDDLWREMRYAGRNLRRMPASATAAAVSLGLGIGVVTVVLSIADAVFFRDLNVPHPERLVSLYQRGDDGRGMFSTYSYPHYELLREGMGSLEGLAAYGRLSLHARITEGTERLTAELVSDNYFQVLGVAPGLGRAFLREDGDVVVLGNRIRRERFGADAGALGRKVLLNGKPFTVIGVLPERFQSVTLDWGKQPDLWIPVAAHAVLPELPVALPGAHWMLTVGRLKPGVSRAQAQSEAEALSARFYAEHPFPGMRFKPVALATREARFWPAYRSSVSNYLALLAAVAALTFLMACFNVANLLLGRAERRQKELGVQVAIGAGRGRLARALMIEAAGLTVGGMAVALAFASLGPAILARFPNAFGIPLAIDLSLSWRVAGIAAALAGVATVLIGVSPARVAWRTDLSSLIKGGSGARRPGRVRMGEVLVCAQVAICLVAVAGAGLFQRTLRHAQESDPMFRAGNALLTSVDLLTPGYDEGRGKALLRELLGAVRQLPGVQAAGYVKTVPLGGVRGARDVRVNGAAANVQVNTVSAGYFAAAGLPVVRGRDFRDGDTAVVMVNEPMAAKFWPGQEAIGRTLTVRGLSTVFEVAGVVRDGRMRTFRDAEIAPCLYMPVDAELQKMITLYARTSGNPLGVAAGVRSAMQRLNGDLPFEARTMESHLETALSRERLAASMLTALGVFTTLLAAIGLYGIISVAVTQRAREIGIRMALGARSSGVVVAVLRRFCVLLAVGAAAGLGASAGLTRLVETWVYGVKPADPATLGAACGFLVVVAGLAAAAPAMRAARTDPMSVLREE